jgi:hypothetical protein
MRKQHIGTIINQLRTGERNNVFTTGGTYILEAFTNLIISPINLNIHYGTNSTNLNWGILIQKNSGSLIITQKMKTKTVQAKSKFT